MNRTIIGLLVGTCTVGLTIWSTKFWQDQTPAEPTPEPTRLTVTLRSGVRINGITVSPDGRKIIYAGWNEEYRQLYLREIDRFEFKPIPGTKGAASPFFSTDGQWIGFFADGSLWKLKLDHDTPKRLCPAPTTSVGASWGTDNKIIFAPGGNAGLQRISASGGNIEKLTQPNHAAGEISHGWPSILPGSEGVLFTILTKNHGTMIAVLSLGSNTWTPLLPGTGRPQFSIPGRLVYSHEGELQTASFDVKQLRLTGAPQSTDELISTEPFAFDRLGKANFSLSNTGTLVYIPSQPRNENMLVWVNRDGRSSQAAEWRMQHNTPRLSPNEHYITVVIRSGILGRQIWTYNVENGTRVQFTLEGNDNRSPVWTEGGRELAFASNRSGPQNIYRKPVRTDSKAQLLASTGDAMNPTSWSTEARVLAFYTVSTNADRDIWTLQPKHKPRAFLTSPLNERSPMISPDGRLIAYVSGSVGESTVHIAAYPDPKMAPSVKVGKGVEPLWTRSGRELLYRYDGRMMSMSLVTTDPITTGRPQVLFEDQYELDPGGNIANYDVTQDGKKFLMVQSTTQTKRLHVVLNWTNMTQ